MENSTKNETAEPPPSTSLESNCYLLTIDHKCSLFLAEEILKTLGSENNLTVDQQIYWLERAKTLGEIAEINFKLIEERIKAYEREQAINALVPFAKNAHLN